MIEHVLSPLSDQQADYVEKIVSDNFFPWFYFPNTHDFDKHSHLSYGFQHTAMQSGNENSQFCEIAKFVTLAVANRAGLLVDSIVHLRFNLLTRQENDIPPHFHTDIPQSFFDENPHFGKHYSALYYINDSDGCTVFEDSETKVSPVKNTGLVFDGKLRHSASYPKNSSVRLVLNMNFFVQNQD
jgi:hypothetical protein